jgi:hypothetical protein
MSARGSSRPSTRDQRQPRRGITRHARLGGLLNYYDRAA